MLLQINRQSINYQFVTAFIKMSSFNIEEYLNSLPKYIYSINLCGKNLTYIPSLKRFKNLIQLKCDNNQLTQLPELNDSLEFLSCQHNKLTKLPELNSSLQILNCSYNYLTQLPELNSSLEELSCQNNQLTCLPELNSSLKNLYCYNNQLTCLPELNSSLTLLTCDYNQLTCLPELNSSLQYLSCYNNQLPFKLNHYAPLTNEKRNELNQYIKCLERFKELYHSLKFKRQFRDCLWIKVRLPRIQNQFHPDNLEEMLYNINEEDLDETLNKW